MMARRLPGILPPLTFDEALEVTRCIRWRACCRRARPAARRPFRAPHHTISDAALVGGGPQPRPGEVSLAHHGVLFLDEMPEFSRHVLEVLRQPLEEGASRSRARRARTSSRALHAGRRDEPVSVRLLGDASGECRCTPQQIERYRGRLSGPLRDRMDLTVEVPALPPDVLALGVAGRELGRSVRARVVAARERQRQRYAGDGTAHERAS